MIYFLRSSNLDGDRFGHIKIGFSGRVNARANALRTHHGAVQLLGMMEGDRKTEAAMHARFAEYLNPAFGREWFISNSALTEFIRLNANIIPSFPVVVTEVEQWFLRFMFLMARTGKQMSEYRENYRYVTTSYAKVKAGTGVPAQAISTYHRGYVSMIKSKLMLPLAHYYGIDPVVAMYPARHVELSDCIAYRNSKNSCWTVWLERYKEGGMSLPYCEQVERLSKQAS